MTIRSGLNDQLAASSATPITTHQSRRTGSPALESEHKEHWQVRRSITKELYVSQELLNCLHIAND